MKRGHAVAVLQVHACAALKYRFRRIRRTEQ
jgi:hypothetical protein